jgi:exodeoxyribonuclease VII small subunit
MNGCGRRAQYPVAAIGRQPAAVEALAMADWFDRKALNALTFQFRPKGAGSNMGNAAKTPDNPTFESALAELEQIVSSMEAGQMPLEQSLAAYKRGAELLKYCQTALQDAQQQVKILEDNVLKSFGSPEQ